MAIKIALAGNPNCGKTTLFNALTGSSQYVGNWPGVTVEKKEGKLKKHKDVAIQDLPGIYSLSPYSLEEVVARNYLVEEKPDAILNIVDGTNIERNLYLTTQLVSLGIPVVVAVNMIDVVRRNGDKIDLRKLSQELGCKVVEISALKGEGVTEAAEAAVAAAADKTPAEAPHVFKGSVEHAIAHIEESIQNIVPKAQLRWYAIKIFERDEKVIGRLGLDKALLEHVEQHIKDCEKELDDDAESIVTNQRYAYVKQVVDVAVSKKPRKGNLSSSDKIDRVVTNRWLALPIFAAVVWFMYWIAVQTLGGWLTDWANDGVFGDGWFVYKTADTETFSSDEVNARRAAAEAAIAEAEQFNEIAAAAIEAGTVEAREVPEEYTWETVSGEFDAAQRVIEDWEGAYAEAYKAANGEDAEVPTETGEDGEESIVVDEALAKGVSVHITFDDEESGEIDEEASREYGYEDYLAARQVEEPEPGDFGLWVPGLPALTESLFEKLGIAEDSWVHTLVFDVVFNGVGTILGFVPQIVIVFLFLAFLEDCGYMARVAFVMDRIFRAFGLSGKSFIPMLVGMGCGVPAVLATRTIESRRDRRMTIMLGTYIPCGAKYAIIAMFVTAFFGGNATVATSMYLLGVAVIVFGGVALKKFGAFAGDPAPFVIELPAYHMPTVGGMLRHTWDRTKAYMIKAGTIIFVACVAIWFLMNFSWSFEMVEELDQSILAWLGNKFAWIFAPLGFGTWQGAAATVTAEIAKEQAVADLAMLAGDQVETLGVAKGIFNLFDSFNPGAGLASLAGLSFMVMNLFDPPCLVAIATTFREMGSAKWGWIAVGFQFLVGYCMALVTFQLGKVLFYGAPFGFGTAAAVAVVLAALFLVFRPVPKAYRK
ncbi:MAG: ferrous iron transporter B [Kiritimatiellae bacterium]|nr:ferrous iron transporter B [Kiritimatiellia bacterium]